MGQGGAHGDWMSQGQDGQFHRWVPLDRAAKLLSSNSSWTEWRTGKKKFVRWHRSASELFSGTQVIANFYNGIQVKASKKVYSSIVY